jgi:hypothetical protein
MAGRTAGSLAPAPADQAQAAAEAMRRDPNILKNAAKMMEAMSPEQLEGVTKMMPGAPPGVKVRIRKLPAAPGREGAAAWQRLCGGSPCCGSTAGLRGACLLCSGE